MKANQIIYDIMPEINKSSLELQTEITALIPLFIENLGNPKVSLLNTKFFYSQ